MRRGSRVIPWVLLFCTIATTGTFAQDSVVFTFSKADLSLLEQFDLLDDKLERSGFVLSDPALDQYLAEVGSSIVPKEPLEQVRWRFRAIRDPLPNAFAFGNGSIYIDTGLLALMTTEDQLAAVLAHEITHVTRRHIQVAIRNRRKKAIVATVLSVAAQLAPGGSAIGAAIIVAGKTVPILLEASAEGYGQQQEREADIYSIDRLIGANYEPRQVLEVFRLLGAEDGADEDDAPLFYTSHPHLRDRMAYTRELISARGVPDQDAPAIGTRAARYALSTERAAGDAIELSIQCSRFREAVMLATQLVKADPTRSQHLFLLGEAYRALGPRTVEPAPWELDPEGRKRLRKMSKLTVEEANLELLKDSDSQVVQNQNYAEAERQYRAALAVEPGLSSAYRSLGALYESTGRVGDALEAWRHYLTARPDAPDRESMLRKIDRLQAMRVGL